MLTSLSRQLFVLNTSHHHLALRHLKNKSLFKNVRANETSDNKFANNQQIEYINSVLDSDVNDWSSMKKNVLNLPGSINQKNIDAVLMKTMINSEKMNVARKFANYLKSHKKELNLGAINSLLKYYYELSITGTLTDIEKQFIIDTYDELYKKYKMLDFETCDKLLHALCIVNEWEKALKVLENSSFSSTPTHSSYSTLIATLFKNNRETEALNLIMTSLKNNRPLLNKPYEEWINFILRYYKDDNEKLKQLDSICLHLAKYSIVVPFLTAEKLRDTYKSLGWNAQYTSIVRNSGQCSSCKSKLQHIRLTEEEFQKLQKNIKDKLIVGKDLFLKTSPGELKKFMNFIESTEPYDIVLDILNLFYMSSRNPPTTRIEVLENVIDYFRANNKKRILLLGREHVLKWPKKSLNRILEKTSYFLTDNLSQDDPYFITAAILNGSHTDLVTKDLLRGHMYILKDSELQSYFKKWRWQHQWNVFTSGKPPYFNIEPPLRFTPWAQKVNNGWHIPYEKREKTSGEVKDGVPDLNSWLCLSPNVKKS